MTPMNGLEDREVTPGLANAFGFGWIYGHPSEILDPVAWLTPTFAKVSFAKLDEMGSVQWSATAAAPEGTPVMHTAGFACGKDTFVVTDYILTGDKVAPSNGSIGSPGGHQTLCERPRCIVPMEPAE